MTCPDDETGIGSVKPCIIPKIMYFIISIIFNHLVNYILFLSNFKQIKIKNIVYTIFEGDNMTYIYDILLNFNENLVEYFEWNDNDKIKYVKKIILFKVSSKVIEDIIYNDVLFDSSFTDKIPKYEMNGVKDAGSLCLLCDGLMVVGLLIRNNKVSLVSRMILEEEQEVIEMCDRLSSFSVLYKIIGKNNKKNSIITREEERVLRFLKVEFVRLYEEGNLDKFMYLYYEFTGKECNSIDYIYKYLISSLEVFTDKHMKLYEVLNLSNAKLN